MACVTSIGMCNWSTLVPNIKFIVVVVIIIIIIIIIE